MDSLENMFGRLKDKVLTGAQTLADKAVDTTKYVAGKAKENIELTAYYNSVLNTINNTIVKKEEYLISKFGVAYESSKTPEEQIEAIVDGAITAVKSVKYGGITSLQDPSKKILAEYVTLYGTKLDEKNSIQKPVKDEDFLINVGRKADHSVEKFNSKSDREVLRMNTLYSLLNAAKTE